MTRHEHGNGEWCDECALAADIAALAKHDYQRGVWYHDSLSTYRTSLDGDSGVTTFPVPQGAYWLISRVTWMYPTEPVTGITASPALIRNDGGLVVPFTGGAMLDTTDALQVPSFGVHDFPTAYELAPGMYVELTNVPAGGMNVEVTYRIRTIVPSPQETRKRLFFTPVITPDDGGAPVSDAEQPTPKRAIVTELDTTAFKNAGI